MRFILGAVFLAISHCATGVPPPLENPASVTARLRLIKACPQITSQCRVPTTHVAQIPELVTSLNCILQVTLSTVPAGECHDALASVFEQHAANAQLNQADSSTSAESVESSEASIEPSSGEDSSDSSEVRDESEPPMPFPFLPQMMNIGQLEAQPHGRHSPIPMEPRPMPIPHAPLPQIGEKFFPPMTPPSEVLRLPNGHGPMPHGPMPHGPMPHGPMPHGPMPNMPPMPEFPMPRGPMSRGPVPRGPMPEGPMPEGPMPEGPRPMPLPHMPQGLMPGKGPQESPIMSLKRPMPGLPMPHEPGMMQPRLMPPMPGQMPMPRPMPEQRIPHGRPAMHVPIAEIMEEILEHKIAEHAEAMPRSMPEQRMHQGRPLHVPIADIMDEIREQRMAEHVEAMPRPMPEHQSRHAMHVPIAEIMDEILEHKILERVEERMAEQRPPMMQQGERSPFEHSPFEHSPFERSPFEHSPFERSPFERSAFEHPHRSPFEQSHFGQHERSPFEQFEQSPFEQRSPLGMPMELPFELPSERSPVPPMLLALFAERESRRMGMPFGPMNQKPMEPQSRLSFEQRPLVLFQQRPPMPQLFEQHRSAMRSPMSQLLFSPEEEIESLLLHQRQHRLPVPLELMTSSRSSFRPKFPFAPRQMPRLEGLHMPEGPQEMPQHEGPRGGPHGMSLGMPSRVPRMPEGPRMSQALQEIMLEGLHHREHMPEGPQGMHMPEGPHMPHRPPMMLPCLKVLRVFMKALICPMVFQ